MSPETVCRMLNEVHAADPVAVDALLRMRTLCNLALAKHATVQVLRCTDKVCLVGVLGLINGVMLCDGQYVKANYDLVTHRLTGFVLERM